MPTSEQLFERARQVMPGGVNSPVRAYNSVGGTPRFTQRAEGAYLFDEDGNHYIDYVGSYGPMILGHAHADVVAAVREAAGHSLSFGTPCADEVRLAELICKLVPSIESVRLVNSGTEATMTALRLARGATGRNKIVKFAGCYHGHADPLLVKPGSGALTLGLPGSPGIPEAVTQDTLIADYNDPESVRAIFAKHGSDVAGLIVEPVAGNMNCVPPEPGFLETLREVCTEHGALLIFDEVMTGFRVARGGAQERFGIQPDLTALGKVVGGGMPVGAVGGPRATMEQLAPAGGIYQSGTLSGNPITMAAGVATLEAVAEDGFHQQLEARTRQLCEGLQSVAKQVGVPMQTQQAGGMFGLFFTDADKVSSFDAVAACDSERFGRFFHAMLDNGVCLAPSAFEAAFMSAAHTDTEIDRTLEAADRALRAVC